MRGISYTTINHVARRKLGLTWTEYGLVDLIYHLSNRPDSPFPGWCYAKRDYLAEQICVSRKTITNLMNSLIKKGLLKRDEETKNLQSTATWFDEVYLSKPMGKITRVGQELPAVEGKDYPSEGQLLPSLPIYKDIDKDIRHIAAPSEQADIVTVMDAFKKATGWLPNYGNKTERAAVSRLLREFGMEEVLSRVSVAGSLLGKEYSPQVRKPSELFDKWSRLVKKENHWNLDEMFGTWDKPKPPSGGSASLRNTPSEEMGVF